MKARELLAPQQIDKLKFDSIGDCAICGKSLIFIHPDEVRIYEDKPVHDDCYFEKLGELVEKHPINSPRYR